MPAAPPQLLRCAVPTRSAAELQAEEHRYVRMTSGTTNRNASYSVEDMCGSDDLGRRALQAKEHRHADMTKGMTMRHDT